MDKLPVVIWALGFLWLHADKQISGTEGKVAVIVWLLGIALFWPWS